MTSSTPVAPPSALGDLIRWARSELDLANADSSGSTAHALLELGTGIRREMAIAHPEQSLSPTDQGRFAALVERRCAREPLAYIVGSREFYGRAFEVSPATLIPRPETEGLVELAREHIPRPARAPFRIVDVGTGSGAIAVTLLAEHPDVRVLGTDIDVAALRIARRNAIRHHVEERLELVAARLSAGIRAAFPLVVANLPYVPTGQIDTLEPEVARYEPRHALDGGPTGTELIADLLGTLETLLAPGGTAIFEFGDGQAELLRGQLARVAPGLHAAVERDAFGSERFLVVERSARA